MITSQMETDIFSGISTKYEGKNIHEDLNEFRTAWMAARTCLTYQRNAWHQGALWEDCKLLEGVWAVTSMWMLF